MVGADGFEPPTLCSQSRCATRLRHAPIKVLNLENDHTGLNKRGQCKDVKSKYNLLFILQFKLKISISKKSRLNIQKISPKRSSKLALSIKSFNKNNFTFF